MEGQSIEMASNRSDLIEDVPIDLQIRERSKFKISTFLSRVIKSRLMSQAARFLVYAGIVALIMSLVSNSHTPTIYSITSADSGSNGFSLSKQIPGIFPALSNKPKQLLSTWDVNILSGRNGSVSFKSLRYQIEFKHTESKPDVVYITKENCQGHFVLNWEVYGHNIYFTDYAPLEGEMTIPNIPKDEQCIRTDRDIVNLIKHSTIWTITENSSRASLFLLLEESSQDASNDFVLISDESIKS